MIGSSPLWKPMNIILAAAFLAVLLVNFQWVPVAVGALALVLFSRRPDGAFDLGRFLYLIILLVLAILLVPIIGAWL